MIKPLFFKSIVLVAVSGLLNSHCVAQSASFSYTGSAQTYLVPKGVHLVSVDLQGASGGSSDFSRGGYGGRVQCMLAVTPGDVLYVYVGSAGAKSNLYGSNGGFNGGGSGSATAAGGGGSSDIRLGGSTSANRVVVAGGGGGGAAAHPNKDYDKGGNGGGLSAENGYSFSQNLIEHGGGGGITRSITLLAADGEGKPGNRGEGYDDDASFGGGGGGYAGGLGGGSGPYGGGGGGGSSFADPLLTTEVVHTQGYNTGADGRVIIAPAAALLTQSSGSECQQRL